MADWVRRKPAYLWFVVEIQMKAEYKLQAANNESSEVCDIIKPGRRVKVEGHMH